MKKIFYAFSMAVMMLALSSCQQSKEDYMNELREFVADVKADADEFTEDDWKNAAEDFEDLIKKADKIEGMGVKETMEMVKIQGEFAAVKVKEGLKEGKKMLEEMKKELEK